MEKTLFEAKQKMVRISPLKLRLVADVVRGKDALESLDTLRFLPKKGSDIVAKVLASAIANAEHNFKANPKNLIIKEILVNEGMTLKRARFASRGRVRQILKRTASVTIRLADKKLA